MATVCSTCGEQNTPDAQFCSSCRSYLGWQDHATQTTAPLVGAAPVPDGSSPSSGSQDVLPSPRHGASAERDPFEAGIEVADAALTLDGAPATVSVNVANTSTVVDSYLVVAVDAPSWLEVRPGRAELLPSTSGTVATELRVVSRGLVPAQQLSVTLRISNTTGRSTYRDLPVVVTVPVVTAPIGVRTEPRLLRARDGAEGTCRVVVSNSGSNRWAQVRLSASDPEQVVRATWSTQQLQVPPEGEESTEVRFAAPAPEPGGEVSRTVTIVAREGHRQAEATVTFTQSASHAAIETLALRLDPSVLRLGGRRRGRLTAVVDNRRGRTVVGVTLSGHDPEESLRFELSPSSLQVQPGQEARVSVTVAAPRTPAGQEVTRPLTISASDGRADIRADGSVIQLASSRRGLARVVLTALGGLLMILGSLLRFVADTGSSAFDLTATQMAKEVDATHPEFGIPDQLNAGGVENVVSIGLFLIVLAGLLVFGLTGRSGRLTRVSALLGAVVVVATFVGSATLAGGSGPASGAVVAFIGCAVGYVGGLVARR